MRGLSTERKLLAVAGFIVLGLSPSFVDWQQSPDKRRQIVLFYGAGVALFWAGLLQ
jgi:hypothetical protein